MVNMSSVGRHVCILATIMCLLILEFEVLTVRASLTDKELLIVSIATDTTDGLRQYLKTAKKYGLDVKIFGMGQKWDGGDVANTAGGGHKINILKEGLEMYKDREDLLLMFTDSYDVVFTRSKEEILEKFQKFNARVIFSAESFCWPDSSLSIKYPMVKANEVRYLNSGGFMGYAKDIYEIVTHKEISNQDDDQLYYTQIYLDPQLRRQWGMKLDTKSDIFQNLNGALGDVTIKFKSEHSYLYNLKTGTTPAVVHGNGPIKPEFYRMSNYLADGWTTTNGCQSCEEDMISLENLKDTEYPTVLMGLFIENPTPFISEFFQRVENLNYPKAKMDLFIHNTVDLHNKDVVNFLEKNNDDFRSTTVLMTSDGIHEKDARNWAIEECAKKNCQYYFSVDSYAQLKEPDTLKVLIEQNRTVIAPLLVRPYKLWSNFWGAVKKDGWYARSEDYLDIVEYKKIGLWNAPFMNAVYLVHGAILPKLQDAYIHEGFDADMGFCMSLRERGIFMYVTNRHNFGHVVDYENMETTHLHNDLYEIFNNPLDWEEKYIHANYYDSLKPENEIEQPCPDVYWFPIVKDMFCQHLIEELENLNQWSGGKNHDPRIASGYENVPTVDTHMNQAGLEKQWLHFLKKYVSPLQQRVFTGYYHDPPHAIMNFVVRYRPNEQDRLRPHHDSSTFTINIALNTPKVDFEGGGCRFIRYNCSVQATRRGWMLMHPGRLTHYHEGLVVTAGTRYIMISFVDP